MKRNPNPGTTPDRAVPRSNEPAPTRPVIAVRARLSHRETWWSAIGGFLGIAVTLWIGLRVVDGPPAMALVASMGASAVLLFAAPHSPLSQPWNVVGGHLVSAVVGVACWRVFGGVSVLVAAPAAAGLAILLMHYSRCLHPPGGATALVAVIGGDAVHALGFEYVLRPIALDVAVILVVALGFGALSKPRRYPVSSKPHAPPVPTDAASGGVARAARLPRAPIDHEDLVFALESLDTHIDVAPDDLLTIYRLATGHHADEDVHRRLTSANTPAEPPRQDT